MIRRADLQKEIQKKVDRYTKGERPPLPHVVPMDELENGAWYVGDSWCGHVAMWDGEFFVSLKIIRSGVVESVVLGYVGVAEGSGFTPFKRVPNLR